VPTNLIQPVKVFYFCVDLFICECLNCRFCKCVSLWYQLPFLYINWCKGLLYQWLWFPSMQSSSTGAANLLQRPLFIIPRSKFPKFSHLLLWIQAPTINWPPTADFLLPRNTDHPLSDSDKGIRLVLNSLMSGMGNVVFPASLWLEKSLL
jgi:hypothetical protein